MCMLALNQRPAVPLWCLQGVTTSLVPEGEWPRFRTCRQVRFLVFQLQAFLCPVPTNRALLSTFRGGALDHAISRR